MVFLVQELSKTALNQYGVQLPPQPAQKNMPAGVVSAAQQFNKTLVAVPFVEQSPHRSAVLGVDSSKAAAIAKGRMENCRACYKWSIRTSVCILYDGSSCTVY